MRIIAGRLKKRKLHPIRKAPVRPTADRLRETIFNILDGRTVDAVVLDLFAGSGALGLEALSRGALIAVFIDRDPDALALIRRNVDTCQVQPQSTIYRSDIRRSLRMIHGHQPPFDLIFMDPPYGQNCIGPAMNQLKQSHAVKKEALVVIEHAADEPLPDLSSAFRLDDQRRYGKTLVSFLAYML